MTLIPQLGIDLGTANILVYKSGAGVVMCEPTVVATDSASGTVLAVGNEARNMLGRTPGNITAVRPLRDGVVSEYTVTMRMLRHIFEKVCGRTRLFRPRVMICVPSGVTSVERRAVIQAAKDAGAGETMTIEEPMAAAIGAGLPVWSPGGNMVVDIGGGTADIAILSLGGIVASVSIRVAGNKFDEAIAKHVRNSHNLMIGESAAEEIKIEIGSAAPLEPELRTEIRGRDLLTGLPKTVHIGSEEVREALAEPVRAIATRVCEMLEQAAPEVASDISRRGITLTGGGAQLRGLDTLLEKITDIPIRVAPDPLRCVVLGTGRALEELQTIRQSGAVSTI